MASILDQMRLKPTAKSINALGSLSTVTVFDTLPAGTTFVSATPSQGNCSGAATVVCSPRGSEKAQQTIGIATPRSASP